MLKTTPERIAARRGLYRPIAGAMPIQSEAVIGLAKEAVFGTLVAPSSLYFAGVPTIRGNQKITRPDQARGTRAQVVDVVTGYEVDVTLVGELVPDKTTTLMAAATFGNGSDAFVSAGGVATHTLTPQAQCPSVSVEVDYDVIPGEQLLARQVAGCILDQFQIKATNQSIAQVTASLVGQRELTPTTPGLPSNTNPLFFNTIEPMDFSLMAATYKGGSTTQLLDVTLAVLNHTQRVFASNGQLYVTRLVPTKREVTLATLLDFLDTTFYTDWIVAAKTGGFVFTLTAATNIPGTSTPWSVQFTVPGTRPMGEYSLTAASDVIQQNIQWSCTLSGANDVSSVWTNNVAGALA